MAARFLQAQQNHHLSGTNLPELALQQQLFGHQLLQQKILEEQLARNRDFFLVSEQAEREKHASQLGLIFHQVRFLSYYFSTMVPNIECISSIHFSLFGQRDQKQKKSAVLFVYFFSTPQNQF